MGIECGNLFMMCRRLNEAALTDLPEGFHIRTCRRDELELWKTIHFDDPVSAEQNSADMTEYFDRVYAPQGDAFWNACLFLCDGDDAPVGTCFPWKAYGKITTVHWFKIKKEYEGRGLGRALLSRVMRSVASGDYPVYLHTHPACCRAIKLYSDFGFALLTDARVGFRANDLTAALPYLRERMPASVYCDLRLDTATDALLSAAGSSAFGEF